jgi:hypothetical protein
LTGNLALVPLFEESTKLMLQLKEGNCDEPTLANYRAILTETRAAVEVFIAEP